jgi:hypothetical protein
MPVPDYKPTDTCARCGLQRRTRELEEQGITLRLCDDCYWGREFAEPTPEQQTKNGKNASAA